MKHFNGWAYITLITLILLVVLFAWFRIQSGLIITCLVLGFYLAIMLDTAIQDSELTRKQVDEVRKGNY